MGNLRIRRRVGIAALVLPIALVAPTGARADSAGHSGARRVITPASHATLRNQVTVLTGSSDWLVYRTAPALASGVAYYGPVSDVSRRRLVARARDGHEVSLGSVPHDRDWSVYGDWLVAEHGAGFRTSSRIDLWHLTTGVRSTLKLPSRKDDLVSAAPGGALYKTPRGTLGRAHRGTARVTTYGKPVGSNFFSGVSGPHGALLYYGATAVYVSFARLAQPQTLDIPTTYEGVDGLVCTSVDASYAACYGYDATTDSAPVIGDLLIPLDGGASTVTTECPGPDAVTGATIVWTTVRYRCSGYPVLMSLHAGDSAPETSTTQLEGDIVAAYGKAVAPQPHSRSILEASSATHSDVLFRTPRSAVAASAVSLSAGQLFDIDDQPDGSRPAALTNVRKQATTRTARIAHRRVAALAPQGKQIDATFLSASAGGVAYAVIDQPAGAAERVRVRSPLGNATISGVQIDSQFTLSGGRVLYQASGTSGVGPWHLYDLVTGSDMVVAKARNADFYAEGAPTVALSGDDLYTHGDGYIYLENLQTGRRTRVAHDAGSSLYAADDHLAWGQASHVSYLNVRTGSAVHTLKHVGFIIGVTPAGMLLQQLSGAIRLHRWGGGSLKLPGGSSYLSARVYTQYRAISPQLNGHLLAWIDTHGRLRTASLNLPDPRPRYLGDVRTSNALASGGQWEATLPYTEPLTACHLTIAQDGKPVRRVACDASLMRTGVAQVSWTGTDSNGKRAATGTYNWALHTRGAAGGALNASGVQGSVHGTIQAP